MSTVVSCEVTPRSWQRILHYICTCNRWKVQVKIMILGHIFCFPLDCSQALLGHRLYTFWTFLHTLINKSGLSFTYWPWISRNCQITSGHRIIPLGKGCEKLVIRIISYWSCFLNHDGRIFRWCNSAWFPAPYLAWQWHKVRYQDGCGLENKVLQGLKEDHLRHGK